MNKDLVYTNAQIIQAIKKISQQINTLSSRKEIVFCPIMTGSIVFAGYLLPLLKHNRLKVNYLHYSRYENNQGSIKGRWLFKPKRDEILNRHIILIDDILDEGLTLAECVKTLKSLGAKTILTTVLFYKPNKKIVMDADIKGLTLPNDYVYGFGLDNEGYDRNQKHIFKKNA